MIKYKYSFYWDIVWYFRNKRNSDFLREKNIKYIPFSLGQLFKNIFFQLKPKIEIEDIDIDVKCYWLSSGTWGAYTPPDKIFICPKDIKKAGGLERVIKHEIAHLIHSKVADTMEHEEKESYIREKENRL